jgi:hypothetical protein
MSRMNPTRGDSRNIATCVNVGVYAHALTYGDEYAILAGDTDRDQVKVRGDNGKPRWYPNYCFDMSGQQVVRLVRTTIDEPRDGLHSVGAVLEFSDGQRRWCYFITPEMLSQLGGAVQFSSERLLSFHSPHMIVVSAITLETIEESLAFIESHGEILDCSLPIV